MLGVRAIREEEMSVDPLVLVALIGAPANLLIGYAAWRNSVKAAASAKSADKAVNHRVNGTTISEDISDIKVGQRELNKSVVWLTRAHLQHLREDHGHDDGQE